VKKNTMDVPSVVGVLIKAIQELSDKIEELKNKN
jgi:hypothetical protein